MSEEREVCEGENLCLEFVEMHTVGSSPIITEKSVSFATLLEALQPGKSANPRIAAVGAGGKTTLLKRLLKEYRILGKKPVMITTTHMKIEDSPQFLVDPTLEDIQKVLEMEGAVTAGARAENGKIQILPPDLLDKVLKLPCPILIEADGARRLPVKIPADHEPVLLPQVTCVLSVYGLDAVQRRIKDVCFRAERVARFLHKDVKEKLDVRDMAALALSDQAGRKGVTEEMQYVIILNKADTQARQELASQIWQEIEKRKGEYGISKIKVLMTATF